jgi:capping protein alpha
MSSLFHRSIKRPIADEEVAEEMSPEEMIQIAQHFLMNAPPGQFGSVLGDVKAILPAGTMTDEKLTAIAREFNTKNLRVLRDGANPPIILAKLAEVDGAPNKYLEPSSGKVYTVDHVKMKVEGEPEDFAGAAEEEARAAVQAAVGEYVEERYMADSAACGVYAAPGALTVIISGEKLNLRNFWSGQFLSTWTVTLSGDSSTIAGEIKIRAHYFEDGNVQLQSKKVVGAAALGAGPVGEMVKAFVAGEEKALQEGLEEMYANMTEETFKAMRRVMPVHRNKMNWNINEVKLNANLRK